MMANTLSFREDQPDKSVRASRSAELLLPFEKGLICQGFKGGRAFEKC